MRLHYKIMGVLLLAFLIPVILLGAAGYLSIKSTGDRAAEHSVNALLAAERDRQMDLFRRKVQLLVDGLNQIEGVHCLHPGGSFYAFPSVAAISNRFGITSHGLAMYLLEGADDRKGVACLGGECFGRAGKGFIRLSCAEPDARLSEAVKFFAEAIRRAGGRHPDIAGNGQPMP